jgi:hypothetical protein
MFELNIDVYLLLMICFRCLSSYHITHHTCYIQLPLLNVAIACLNIRSAHARTGRRLLQASFYLLSFLPVPLRFMSKLLDSM